MKRILSFILCALVLSSCSGIRSDVKQDGIKIVSTVFPAYDWVKHISENTSVDIMLIPSKGVDMHSYQPSAQDIIDISGCDLMICASGEETVWYDDIKPVNCIDISRKNSDGHIDEHSWFSVKYAMEICKEICSALVLLSPENKEKFESNCSEYIKRLEKLDKEYIEFAENAKTNCFVIADRFPFRHMMEAYGLLYEAAFEGCSSESEISFDTVKRLSGKIKKDNITDIFITETSDGKIAEAVVRNLNNDDISINTLDSMQSVTAKELKSASYIEIMSSNLEVLKEVL